MKRTGELLRKAREEKNLTILEIGLSLKINSKILSAIEDGDLTKLPAKTFLRGFVQSYANYLKMNSDEVMALFTEEMGTTRPQAKMPVPEVGPDVEITPASMSEPVSAVSQRRSAELDKEAGLSGLEDRSRTKALILSAVCVLLVILIFSTKKVIDRYQRESIPAQVEITAPLPEPPPLAEELPAKPTAADGSATVPPPGGPMVEEKPAAPAAGAVATPAVASTSATSPTGLRSEPVKKDPPATPVPPPAPAPTVKAPVTPPPVAAAPTPPPTPAFAAKPVTPPPVPPAPVTPPPVAKTEVKAEEKKPEEKPPEKKAAKSLELIVEALDTVTMEYSSANGEIQKLTLEAGKVHTIRSRAGLKLNVNNGGAVNVILNGRDLGAPGDIGKPVTLSY